MICYDQWECVVILRHVSKFSLRYKCSTLIYICTGLSFCSTMSMFNDPWQPSGRSTWPDAANGVEHEYMRLPGKRKMIKIQQTIYEDPGNPFQDELDAERMARGEAVPDRDKALPEAPGEVSPTGRSFFEFDTSYEPFEKHGQPEPERSRSLDKPLPCEPSEVSPTAKSFRFGSIGKESDYGSEGDAISPPAGHAVAKQDPIPTRRQYHRSMSLAVPNSPPLTDEYVSPRRFWRRENSLPLMKGVAEEKSENAAPASARDTVFYGFYEDLMKDYDKRKSKM